MGRSINLSLTDELHAFVVENSGEGTPFSTPSEFVRSLIREKKECMVAAEFRNAVLEGYGDALHDRAREYTGDLRAMLEAFRRERRPMHRSN